MDNEYVLAMYDIRGKQDYIYRSNKIKEIVGGSAIIRDCFKMFLYPAAKEYRDGCKLCNAEEAIFDYKYAKENSDFERKAFKQRMSGNQYIGEVIYNGGGNFFVLYKNAEICREVNKIFTKNVLENTYSLKVLCTFIDNVNFDNYREDRDKLYTQHRSRESSETNEAPAQVLPFTQVDRGTSMPLYKKHKESESEEAVKMSRERFYKYNKYDEVKITESEIFGELVLDNLVTEKGEESLLAVIYIDGNNMGAKVMNCLKGKRTYEDCIKEMRKFSETIQKNYVDDAINKINDILIKKYKTDEVVTEKNKDKIKRRFIIYAGDEINFICNARDAYDIARAYLESLPENDSACAGIAIFHSHAPYSEAYRIAEECCESGKTKMKECKIDNASLIDFHYCQGGIGINLETIRKIEIGNKISKPWFIKGKNNGNERCITAEIVDAMVKELNTISRTNVKSLASHAKDSIPSLKMEIKRIIAHSKSDEKPDIYLEKFLGKNKLNDDEMSRLIYDIIIVYDLWFEKQKGVDK